MAMYNYNLNSFKQVEHMFHTTKPIRGSTITPLGDRARKWENIHKVSADCYVLLDNWSDPKYKGGNWYHTVEQLIELAAVKWTRNPDGSETIRIRNASGDYAHNSRYSFLQRALPSGMNFIVDSGKQYIRSKCVTREGKRHYLPKGRTITNKMLSRYDIHSSRNFYCTEYDNLHVEFTRVVGGDWALTSKSHKVPVIRTRILKEEKAPFKDDISDFLHWAWDMAPILNSGRVYDWMENHTVRQRVTDYTGGTRDCMVNFRQAISNSEHEDRVDLVVHFLIGYQESVKRTLPWGDPLPPLADDPKYFRAKFNTWINDLAGFTEKFQEYKD